MSDLDITSLVETNEWDVLPGDTEKEKAIYKLGENLHKAAGKSRADTHRAYAQYSYDLFSRLQKQRNGATFVSFEFAIKGTKQKHHIPSSNKIDRLSKLLDKAVITSPSNRSGDHRKSYR